MTEISNGFFLWDISLCTELYVIKSQLINFLCTSSRAESVPFESTQVALYSLISTRHAAYCLLRYQRLRAAYSYTRYRQPSVSNAWANLVCKMMSHFHANLQE